MERRYVSAPGIGLTPIAFLSMAIGLVAAGAVVSSSVSMMNSAEPAIAVLTFTDSSQVDPLSRPDRPQRTQFVVPAGISQGIASDAEVKSASDRPSDKGRSSKTATAGFDESNNKTDQDDFTGGREALFSDYTQTRQDDRQERSYQTAVLPRGETIADVLSSVGGAADEVEAILAAVTDTMALSEVSAGAAIEFAFEPIFSNTADGEETRSALARLRLRPDARSVVTAWRRSDGLYTSERRALEVERRFATVGGVINNSLFASGAAAQVPPEIMARFANLFLFDVDFARDIHAGDRFEAVYEVFFDERGQAAGTGEILFAGMTWRGQRGSRSYYRYDGGQETRVPYYDASGESASRLLMKTPIEGGRVTSGFGPRRHPIMGYSRDHHGVDFGAPAGTPIMAAGDGRIARAAPTGSFGNYIKIEHTGGFETAYAHLRGFAPGIRQGAQVRQGDIIGYVGTTGRSTGPHLHYEVLRNGEAQNPITLDVAFGDTIGENARETFEARLRQIDALRVRPLTVSAATDR